MKRYLLFLFFILSCKSASNNEVLIPEPTDFAQPVIQPLKFSKPKKIDWNAIKAVKVQPVVTKLNWDKLTETHYDTSGFKPFKYPAEEIKFDYNALPSKDLDIDKLSSRPLKFSKSYMLPPPKLIKGAKLQVKNGNLLFLNFGEDQNTKSTYITNVLTDRNGLLWIASLDGIYRYDGENLLLFLQLPSPWYQLRMTQDKQGRLWLSELYHNIYVMDPQTGITKVLGEYSHGNNSISHLIWHNQKQIWATSSYGSVNIIDTKTETVRSLDKVYGFSPENEALSAAMDKNGNLWIPDRLGVINIIDLKKRKIKRLENNDAKATLSGFIYGDAEGRIWIGYTGGLIKIVNLQKNTIQTIRELQSLNPRNTISGLVQSNKGPVWVSTSRNGIGEIYPEKHLGRHLTKNEGLISNDITSITQDALGNKWISSGIGVNMFANRGSAVEHIGKELVTSCIEDNGGLIWDATAYHGLDILNRKNSTSRHLGVKQGLFSDSLIFIKAINNKYAICSSAGLEIVDTSKNIITHLGKKQFFDNKDISAIAVDNEGSLWIAFWDGLGVYDPKNGTFKHLEKAVGIISHYISHICVDPQGQTWIASYSGVLRFDNKTNIVQNLVNYNSLQGVGVVSVTSDHKGNIWFGTAAGVYIIAPREKAIIFLSTQQGLKNDFIFSLLNDKAGVFAGTNHGIILIIPPKKGLVANEKWSLLTYSIKKVNTFITETDFITRDGNYLWGDSGITVLNLKKNTIRPTAYINGISVFGHRINFTDKKKIDSAVTDTLWEYVGVKYYLKGQFSIKANNELQNGLKWEGVTGLGNMPVNLRLPYNQNFIQFHYSSFNFTPHDTATYRYILLGADKKWSSSTSESSSFSYTSLQPGKYTFEVISKNADNVWSKPAKFSFIITPPWWQTWWAYILYVLSFAGIIWCFVYFRSRQLVKEKLSLEHQVQIRTNEILQQKEEIETQRDHLEMEKVRSGIAADFHDELGSTLSSIALYSQMAINESSADERTKNILSLIGESSRGTVSAMQDMIWTIQPKNDKMQEVVFRMQEYAYPLAELKNIAIAFDVADEVRELVLSMDIRKNIYLIFKEALNNAFKYASPLNISISIAKRENQLYMQINDDGKGFDLINQKGGNGLGNMQKRAEQAGGALLIESKPGCGTEILFNCTLS